MRVLLGQLAAGPRRPGGERRGDRAGARRASGRRPGGLPRARRHPATTCPRRASSRSAPTTPRSTRSPPPRPRTAPRSSSGSPSGRRRTAGAPTRRRASAPTADGPPPTRKVQLFGGAERTPSSRGRHCSSSSSPAVRVAPLICFDVEFPEPARAVAEAGAELLVTVAANMEPYGDDHAPAPSRHGPRTTACRTSTSTSAARRRRTALLRRRAPPCDAGGARPDPAGDVGARRRGRRRARARRHPDVDYLACAVRPRPVRAVNRTTPERSRPDECHRRRTTTPPPRRPGCSRARRPGWCARAARVTRCSTTCCGRASASRSPSTGCSPRSTRARTPSLAFLIAAGARSSGRVPVRDALLAHAAHRRRLRVQQPGAAPVDRLRRELLVLVLARRRDRRLHDLHRRLRARGVRAHDGRLRRRRRAG